MNHIKIFFDEGQKFELPNIRTLSGIIGLYFIYNEKLKSNTHIINRNWYILEWVKKHLKKPEISNFDWYRLRGEGHNKIIIKLES